MQLELYGIVIKDKHDKIISIATDNHSTNKLFFYPINSENSFRPFIFDSEKEAKRKMSARIYNRNYYVQEDLSKILESLYGIQLSGIYFQTANDTEEFLRLLSIQKINVNYEF